jgi:hypothetical protein
MTHFELCRIALAWLKRPNSQGGHGCNIAVSECRSGWSGEVPDAIGFRAIGHGDGSVVVEAKTSRADFLADAKKLHRARGAGMGNWRYFICREGLIRADDLPVGWGVLWVNSRGHVKPIAGAAASFKSDYDVKQLELDAYRQVSDVEREQWLLVRLLARVGDPNEVNERLKEARAARNRLAEQVHALEERVRAQDRELYVARSELRKRAA